MPYLSGHNLKPQNIISEADKDDKYISMIFDNRFHMIVEKNNFENKKLFDISSDPKEKNNIIKKFRSGDPQKIDSLLNILREHLEKAKSEKPEGKSIDIPDEDIEKFQTLGYLRSSRIKSSTE